MNSKAKTYLNFWIKKKTVNKWITETKTLWNTETRIIHEHPPQTSSQFCLIQILPLQFSLTLYNNSNTRTCKVTNIKNYFLISSLIWAPSLFQKLILQTSIQIFWIKKKFTVECKTNKNHLISMTCLKNRAEYL